MLAQPANRHLITKIKASITAGIRPVSMIFHEQPTSAWVPFDFRLLEAYQILQDETCPKCGHPVWLCRSTSPNVEFRVREAYCAADRAMRETEDNERPKGERAEKKDKKSWGRFYYTVPAAPIEGVTLPTRQEYYEEITSAT